MKFDLKNKAYFLAQIENLVTYQELDFGRVLFLPPKEGKDLLYKVVNTFNSKSHGGYIYPESLENIIKYPIAVTGIEIRKDIGHWHCLGAENEQALNRIEQACSILRFLLYRDVTEGICDYFGISGTFLSLNNQQGAWFRNDIDPIPSLLLEGRQNPCVIFSQYMVSWKRDQRFRRLLSMFNEKEKTEISRKVILSLHWLSRALKESSANIKFANLVIGMESLLSSRDDQTFGSINKNLSERVAVLVGKNLKPKDRLDIYEAMREYYGKRSTTLHGCKVKSRRGKAKSQITEEDIRKVGEFLVESILTILEIPEIKKFEDVIKMVNGCKFSFEWNAVTKKFVYAIISEKNS